MAGRQSVCSILRFRWVSTDRLGTTPIKSTWLWCLSHQQHLFPERSVCSHSKLFAEVGRQAGPRQGACSLLEKLRNSLKPGLGETRLQSGVPSPPHSLQQLWQPHTRGYSCPLLPKCVQRLFLPFTPQRMCADGSRVQSLPILQTVKLRYKWDNSKFQNLRAQQKPGPSKQRLNTNLSESKPRGEGSASWKTGSSQLD